MHGRPASQLFYNTMIPACLWFLARDKSNGRFRKRAGETLFIDARNMGALIDRVHRELSPEDVQKIAGTYHAWRGDALGAPSADSATYEDIPGFCKSATLDDIRQHNYVLTPGRYVGAEEVEDDGVLFEDKMQRLTETLGEQFAEAKSLDMAIRKNLKELGFEV